jgi:hypothetical protein
MSSIRPSALVLDDEDDWGTFSPVASAMSRQPSSSLSRSSVASGEYNMFSAVGSVIAGGGIKRELWIFREDVSKLCLGKVGTSKFCIKPVEPGKLSCATARHAQKVTIDKDRAYIRATEFQVCCTPTLPLTGFSKVQLAKLTSTENTASEWESIFKLVDEGSFPEWLQDLNTSTQEEEDLTSLGELLSPPASRRDLRYFSHPKL